MQYQFHLSPPNRRQRQNSQPARFHLQVSANYLLQDELEVVEKGDLEELKQLWDHAEPSQYELVIAMLRAALRQIEEGK